MQDFTIFAFIYNEATVNENLIEYDEETTFHDGPFLCNKH